MIKTRGRNGTMSVTFTLAAAVDASQAAVCGEWNDWSADRDIMERTEDGFTRTVELQAGRCYRFRYLLDGHRWENDWEADGYVPNEHGSDDSLLDLSAPAEAAPEVEDRADATASESAAKKTPAAKKAAPRKRAAAVGGASAELAQPKKAVIGSQPAHKKPARGTNKESAT
jgi:hypothetical protein